MRKSSLVAALAASAALSACVQTRQFADVQFTPPSGDYKLLVLRPDVTVGSLTTGGMVQPRADWTEQARANIIAALSAQQLQRGGKVKILAHRNELPGVSEDAVADLERLHSAVGNSIEGTSLFQPCGKSLPFSLRSSPQARLPTPMPNTSNI